METFLLTFPRKNMCENKSEIHGENSLDGHRLNRLNKTRVTDF